MNSVLFVRCFLYDLLGIVKNLVQLRTEGLTLCRQGQKKEAKELFKKERLKAVSMTYISQKNIIFFQDE